MIGPENLAQLAKKIKAKFLHLSTDYVFSKDVKRLLTESDLAEPCNYYGLTKLEGEKRVLKGSTCVLRTSWVFKEGGKNFVSRLFSMLQTQKKIYLVDDQWSRFTYAPDLAEAIFHLVDHKGLYQFANTGVVSKYEFGLAMKEEAFLMGFLMMNETILPVPSSFFKTSAKRPCYSALSTEKIEPLIEMRHWREALRDFLCAQLPVYS